MADSDTPELPPVLKDIKMPDEVRQEFLRRETLLTMNKRIEGNHPQKGTHEWEAYLRRDEANYAIAVKETEKLQKEAIAQGKKQRDEPLPEIYPLSQSNKGGRNETTKFSAIAYDPEAARSMNEGEFKKLIAHEFGHTVPKDIEKKKGWMERTAEKIASLLTSKEQQQTQAQHKEEDRADKLGIELTHKDGKQGVVDYKSMLEKVAAEARSHMSQEDLEKAPSLLTSQQLDELVTKVVKAKNALPHKGHPDATAESVKKELDQMSDHGLLPDRQKKAEQNHDQYCPPLPTPNDPGPDTDKVAASRIH